MRTTSRLLMSLLTALVLAGCGGSAGSGGSKSAGGTQLTENDGSGAPSVCKGDACEPTPAPQCTADDQCPSLPAACSVCPDGSAACPYAACENGQCNVVVPSCPKPTGCGGIASLPCPDGYVCVTDPSNTCSPDSSGADCPSVCVPQSGPRKCGGLAGGVCPPAYECVDDPSDDCDPAKGGADCIGICQPVDTGTCESDADCPNLKVECSVCPDGTTACPQSACVNGQCNVTVPSCPTPNPCGGIGGTECKPGYECVDDPNDKCDPNAGGADCPAGCVPVAPPPPQRCGGIAGDVCPEGFECVGDPSTGCDPTNGSADCTGICQPAQPAVCKSDADCPQLKVMCGVCANGTATCPQSICVNEQCNVMVPMCPAPNACGGIAGIPCEPGFECVDDPNDKCDPTAGGADCPGICVPQGPPPPLRCAGFAGFVCPAGFECVDDPADNCDPANGGADCGGLCQPVVSPQCTTDADCPVIGAPCKLCADGTAACPRSFCSNGQCAAVFEGCGPTPQ